MAEEIKKPEKQQEKPKKICRDKELRAKVDELTDKLSEEHDDYLRLMAEFETFRRRNAEERQKLISTASADTVKGLLPVLDDCERAMALLEKSSDAAAKEGTALIYNKLMAYLKTCGLEVIEAEGKDFDIDFHEAVSQLPSPSPESKGKVLAVVQTGYLLAGKVLRYAKVVVGA